MTEDISVSVNGVTWRQTDGRVFVNDFEVFGQEAHDVIQKMQIMRDKMKQTTAVIRNDIAERRRQIEERRKGLLDRLRRSPR